MFQVKGHYYQAFYHYYSVPLLRPKHILCVRSQTPTAELPAMQHARRRKQYHRPGLIHQRAIEGPDVLLTTRQAM